MSRSPEDSRAEETNEWVRARYELSEMIKRGRSFSGHEPNCAFLNLRDGTFGTVSAISGFDFPDDARGLALSDWDQDGDLDAWVSNRNAPRLRFLRNDSASGAAWITLDLQGDGRTSNRDAIGARVELELEQASEKEKMVKDRPIVRSLAAGSGFLSQSSKRLTIGLGHATAVRRLIVHWPGAAASTVENLAVNQHYVIRQGEERPQSQPPRKIPDLESVDQPLLAPSRHSRIPLITQLPMVPLKVLDAAGKPATVDFGRGRPVLVNLWASWCGPCLKELAEWSQQAAEIQRSGVDIVALSVDGLGSEPSSVESEQILVKMKFPFRAARATHDCIADLQRYHDNLVVMWRPLPVPTSFLISAEGRLVAIYKGPLEVAQLLQDVGSAPTDVASRQEWGSILPGRALPHSFTTETAMRAEMRTKYRLAVELQQHGHVATAERCLLDLLELDPRGEQVRGRLVRVYMELGKFAEALAQIDHVLQMVPGDAAMYHAQGLALVNLGRPHEALASYQHSLQGQSDDPETLTNYGTALAMVGDLVQARGQLARAIEVAPDFGPAYLNLGRVMAAIGNMDTAESMFQRAAELDPSHPEAFNNLGTVAAQRGDYRKAIGFYQQALQIDPGNQEAQANLSRARERLP